MPKITFQRNPISGKNSYVDDKGRFFANIVGGIVWPSTNPGAVVAIAQEDSWRPPRPAYVLAEFEESTIGELIRKCSYLSTEYCVEDFYGRPDQTCLRYIDQHNAEAQQKRMKKFYFQSAPSCDLPMDYHFNVLRDRLAPGSKTIHFEEGSQLKGQLLAVPEDQLITEDSNYPLVSALAWAVAALIEAEGISEGQKKTFSNYKYDPLNW